MQSPKINNSTYATLFQTIQHSYITVGILRIAATIENQSKPSLVMPVSASRGGGVQGIVNAWPQRDGITFLPHSRRLSFGFRLNSSPRNPTEPKDGMDTILVLVLVPFHPLPFHWRYGRISKIINDFNTCPIPSCHPIDPVLSSPPYPCP